MTKGEEITSRALMIPFLAIHAKGGESMSPKQKDRTTTNFKNLVFSKSIYQLVSYWVQKGEKIVFQFESSKPSWTLRGWFHLGGVLFSQRKSIWNRGRKFQILKMLCNSYSFTFDYLQKELWKEFTKEFCKNKTCGASVVQNIIRKKQSMHTL